MINTKASMQSDHTDNFSLNGIATKTKRQAQLFHTKLTLDERLTQSGLTAIDESHFRALLASQTFEKSQFVDIDTASIFVNPDGRPTFAVLRPDFSDQLSHGGREGNHQNHFETRYFVAFDTSLPCDFYLQFKVSYLLIKSRIIEAAKSNIKGIFSLLARRKNSSSATEWHSVRLTSMQV